MGTIRTADGDLFKVLFCGWGKFLLYDFIWVGVVDSCGVHLSGRSPDHLQISSKAFFSDAFAKLFKLPIQDYIKLKLISLIFWLQSEFQMCLSGGGLADTSSHVRSQITSTVLHGHTRMHVIFVLTVEQCFTIRSLEMHSRSTFLLALHPLPAPCQSPHFCSLQARAKTRTVGGSPRTRSPSQGTKSHTMPIQRCQLA